MFLNACREGNIKKNATVYSHSTVRYISIGKRYRPAIHTGVAGAQEFKDDRDIYDVSNKNIGKINSPLDNLQIRGGEYD